MIKLLAPTVAILSAICINSAIAEGLDVSLSGTAKGILIKNDSNSDISDCFITINSKYKIKFVSIPAKGSKELWYSEVMSSNDVRFDPSLERVQRIHVDCFKPSRADASFAP